jgi:glycosyltransferase involved in cell wall biosynthesis
MRVLLVADVIGGVRTFTGELVRELVGQGVEVDLALIGTDPGALSELGASSCQRRDLRLEWMADPWSDVEATSSWVEELRRRHRPDVVHMNTFAPVLDASVPVLLTVHSCVLTWWRAVRGCEAPDQWGRYREVVDAALRRADVVTAPTRALLRELAAVYGELPRALAVPNGRAVSGLAAATWPSGGGREPLVVTAGRLWDQGKNARLVAEAAPQIDGRVVMIGAGVDSVAGAGVDSVAGAGGDSPRGAGRDCVRTAVEATGALSEWEVASWLARAAVFAEPARYEPFGLAALEAALCGCALVLGDIPSLREVWGDAAAFVSPDDPAQLIEAVNSLLHDPHRRTRHAARARERAARYPPQTMARAYLDLYRQMTRVPAAA